MEKIEEVIKSSKRKLGEKIPCSIEILTPVHIGSGVKLAKDIDFIATRETVTIIPQSELMEYLEENPIELENFIKGYYKLDKINLGTLGKKYPINGERVFDITEFERNGFGKPYIPGSSIKGAIRTILLRKRFNELSPNEQTNLLRQVNSTKKEWASEPIVKKLLGDSSNENLMRALEIFDAEFNEVSLEKVLILSLCNDEATAYKWKRMGRDAVNQDDPSKATIIFVEALPIGAKGYSSISLSNFLFNNPEAKQQLKFSEPSLSDFESFVKTINNYSLEKLNEEKTFFQKLNSSKKLNELLKNIDTLITETSKLQKDEVILRLSWGSGWKGMTGDFLDNEWLQTFRSKYRLGKNNFPIFPKTRRIIFDGNEPKYVTGWIKIKLNDKPSSIETEEKRDEQQDPMEILKQKFKVTETKKK